MPRTRLAFGMLAVGLALAAQAQLFNFSFGEGAPKPPPLEGRVRLEPSPAVVGVPCQFVFSFGSNQTIRIQSVSGLPDKGVAYLAEALEPYADSTYRLPVRFLAPCTNRLRIVVHGMQTTERRSGHALRTFSTGFTLGLPSLALEVRDLPAEGRPAHFSGAVGKGFRLTQTLTPDRVHPGDLVTATYALTYDGYCPSNAWPRIGRPAPEAFRAYEPKEVARTPTSCVWTQVLVPRTAAATNVPGASFAYYDVRAGRYAVAQTPPGRLVFVSDKAASTQTTTVTVNAEDAPSASAGAASAASAPLVLRFGPSDASPVLATLPPDTPAKELARANGWRRLKTPRAIGWSR